jgi:hypothetical protein
MTFSVLGLLASLFFSFSSYACDPAGTTGFMPENDMRVSVDAKFRSDMTEAQFNAIIEKVEKVYKSIIKKRRGKLKIARKWKNNTVNANARRIFNVYHVNMYGGLARHPVVTDDAFALVVCHELGHHLGGAPKIGMMMMKWASNEGQADYWGSMKCFRKVFINDNNKNVVANMKVDEHARQKCEASFKEENEVALCIRASMAGQSLAKLLGGGRATPHFDTPDTGVVDRTNNAHPASQCRLDTYFQGSLCDRPASEDVDKKDPTIGTCNRVRGDELGIRPLCWYKPQS